MDRTDKVLPTNTVLSTNLINHGTPNSPETNANVALREDRKQQLHKLLTGRCLALERDAFIPVHLDSNGVPNEDISSEVPCILYEPYFAAKNKRALNLAIESKGKLRPVLELKALSNFETQNDLNNLYIELFRGTEDCQLLKVDHVCTNRDDALIVTCEGVSMGLSLKVKQFCDELAQIGVAEKKLMP